MLQDLFIPFLAIGLAELGDKTQLASALFATQYNPWLVFIGVIGVLTTLTLIAIYAGKIITEKIPKKTISRLAGLLFIIIGLWVLYEAL